MHNFEEFENGDTFTSVTYINFQFRIYNLKIFKLCNCFCLDNCGYLNKFHHYYQILFDPKEH